MKKIEQKKTAPELQTNRSAKAAVKYLRISPRKVRLVIDPIRFQGVHKAMAILNNLNQKAARMSEKLLKTAIANAKVLGLDESRLYVSEVRADGGPSLKRFMSRSMGRADRLLKRTTHMLLIVTEGQRVFGSSPAAQEAKEVKGVESKTRMSKTKTAKAGK